VKREAGREIFLTNFPVSLKNRRGRKKYLIMDRKKKRSAERPTQAVVNLKAISDNIAQIRKRIGRRRELMVVVKADAYGHGAVPVSRAALRSGATCLGVSSPEEGGELREAGMDIPILVLGLIQPEAADKAVGLKLESPGKHRPGSMCMSKWIPEWAGSGFSPRMPWLSFAGSGNSRT
jgi:hypothetical protein